MGFKCDTLIRIDLSRDSGKDNLDLIWVVRVERTISEFGLSNLNFDFEIEMEGQHFKEQ